MNDVLEGMHYFLKGYREKQMKNKPFADCPNDCENFGHCWNTKGCMERLEYQEKEEFWKLCSFEYIPKKEDAIYGNVRQEYWNLRAHWLYPDNTRHEFLPIITLNSLKKYVLPLVDGYSIVSNPEVPDTVFVKIRMCNRYFTAKDKDIEIALVTAIYKALKAKEEKGNESAI